MTSEKDLSVSSSDAEAESQSEHRMRMRTDWDNLIEDLIQDGFERGAFDNLKGQGKPLNLSSHLYDYDMRLANELLKENKMRPAWITQRMGILAKRDLIRQEMARSWTKYARAWELAQGRVQKDALTLSWDDLCLRWQAMLQKLNKDIDEFNLRRPSNNLELYKLSLEKELERIQAPRYLKDAIE